jgi:hypothetical protein
MGRTHASKAELLPLEILDLQGLYRGDVHHENAPILIFSNQNNAHPMDPLLAGENFVLPENIGDK